MTDDKRRETAKNFVALHKENDIENWTAFLTGEQDPLLTIYYNLMEEATCTNIDEESSDCAKFYCEIGSHESKSGNPILFEFEDDSYIRSITGKQ